MLRRPVIFVILAAAACGPAPPPPATDVTLDPPATGQGFQLAAAPFDVPSGAEVQRCYFFTVPGTGTDPVWISRTVAAQNPGSHHLNVFRVKTVEALDGKDGDVVDGGECWRSANWATWPLVTNSQESTAGHNVVDWALPDGVAHRFVPGEKLMLQTHYVNAATQHTPGRGKALINFHRYPGAGTPMELGTVFATNQNIRVCPGDTNRAFSTTCKFAKTPVTIIAANGHFHSRGSRFEIGAVDATNTQIGPMFYTSTTWDEPPFSRDLGIVVPALGGIDYTCSYNYQRPLRACANAKNDCQPADGTCSDATASCCISFGGHVEVQEHCNAFVYYYPRIENVSCF